MNALLTDPVLSPLRDPEHGFEAKNDWDITLHRLKLYLIIVDYISMWLRNDAA